MKEISNYRKLKVWQKSFSLTLQVYKATKELPIEEKFGLISQMRRCSVSITSNIAEGVGRITPGERRNFYGIALGSTTELQTQILLCYSLGYLKEAKWLVDESTEIQKMLKALIKATN